MTAAAGLFRAMFDAVPDPVWLKDRNGVLVACNPAFEDLFGHPESEIVGKRDRDISVRNGPAFAYRSEYGGLESGQAKIGKATVTGTDGRPRLMEVTSVPVGEGAGLTGILCFGRDVTGHRGSVAVGQRWEALCRSFMEQSPDGVTLVDAESGAFLEFNAAAHQTLGYTPEEFACLRVADIVAVDSASDVARRMDEMLESGGVVFETRHRRKDGVLSNVRVRARPVVLDGRAYFATIWSDISEREHLENMLTATAEFVARDGGEGFFESLVGFAAETFDVDHVHVAWLAPDRKYLRTEAAWQDGKLIENGYVYSLADTPGEKIMTLECRSYPSGVKKLFPRDPDLRRLDAEAYIGEPILDEGGRAVGLIVLVSRRPLEYSDSINSGLRILATRAGAELAKRRSHQLLCDSERRFRTMAEQSSDWIWSIDTELRYTYSNDRGAALLGYDRADFLSRDPSTLVHPDDRSLFRATFEQALAAREGWQNVALRWRHREGGYRDLESSASPVYDDEGKLAGFQGVDRDVTERRRAEKLLDRHNRILQTIAAANRILAEDLEEQALMARVCETLVTENHFRMAWIGRLGADGVRICSVAEAGLSREYLARADIRCDESSLGQGPTGSAVRLGRTIINRDAETNERFAPWRNQALASGFRSSAATPLRFRGEVAGALNLYSDEPDAFGDEEVLLIEKLAADLGRALERREAEAALRESEARVRLLLESASEAIFGVDTEGRFTFVNPACLRILGYEKDEDLLGKNAHTLIHHSYPDGRPYPKERCHVRLSTLEGKTTHIDDEVNFRADGSSFPVEYWSHPMYRAGELVGAVVTFVDVSERKRADKALRESERRYRLISGVTTDFIFSCASESGEPFALRWAGGSAERIFGYSVDEIMERRCWRCFVHPDDLPLFDAHVSAALPGQPGQCELRVLHRNGSIRFLRTYCNVVSSEETPQTRLLYGACQDITAQKSAEEALRDSERRYRALFDASGDGIFVLRGDGIVDCNSVALRIFGCSRDEIVGQSVFRFCPERQPDGRLSREKGREIIDAVGDGCNQIFEWRYFRHEGSPFDAEVNMTSVALEGDAYVIATLRDISERKHAEERIEFLAHHDVLTGLPNRILLRDRFEQAVAVAERERSHVAMLFLDLDNFKLVNDTLGHTAGDKLLQTVVSRLDGCVRDTDTVSRQGGDEFIVLIGNMPQVQSVERIVGEILLSLAEPAEIAGHLLNTACSIGVSLFPEDGGDFDTLLQKADTAMYNAKEAGRNTYRFFDDEMNRQAREHLLLQNQLHQALGQDELRLEFQPQIEIAGGRIFGLEALLRWRNADLGEVLPDRFIPVAEECGLIVPIGVWVLQEACRRAVGWQEAGLGELSVSVNISAVQVRRPDLVDSVRGALNKSGLPAHLLELELTESVLVENVEHTLETVRRLKALGVRLAIDDFGKGYSSLGYLKRFAVDKLKIDRTFLRNVATDLDNASIVRAILQLAQSLRLAVLAEGVETQEQLVFLRDAGCREVQGYLISRPLEGGVLEDFLRGWKQNRERGADT